VSEPSILLADEPTGNLDTGRSREIMELLCQLNREQGLSIAMVTHEAEMAHYAKRIISFRDGRVHTDVTNGHGAHSGAAKAREGEN
jgi:putative ABC transport system ATP-binding protein